MYKDYDDMEKNETEEMLLIFYENKQLIELYRKKIRTYKVCDAI